MNIYTYVGVDTLRFGMRPEAVAQSIGPCNEEDKNFLGELIEYRIDRNLVATYSEANGLVEIGFNAGVGQLFFDKVSLFGVPPADVLRELVQRDGAAMEFVGFVVLRKLGIALSGFQEKPPTDLAVNAFALGRWDRHLAQMKPFIMAS